jgi:hypothetical protein
VYNAVIEPAREYAGGKLPGRSIFKHNGSEYKHRNIHVTLLPDTAIRIPVATLNHATVQERWVRMATS